MMQELNVNPEKAMKELQGVFKRRGTKALEKARNEILQETVESSHVRQALNYFMTKYWHDLARPTLLSLVCEAVDGDPRLTEPFAVSLTLISGAIDIHDDVIDESKTKDGRPTVYGKFGKDLAILVGDALLFKGLALLSKTCENGVSEEKRSKAVAIIKDTFFELGDAEALELKFRRRIDVSPDEYLRIVRKKAADVEAHARIGALVGGGSLSQVEALAEYGRLLGVMIILRDDWLDLEDPEESKHRVAKECLPLPLLYGLQIPRVARVLRPLLMRHRLSKKDAEKILETIRESKAARQYEELMTRLAGDSDNKMRGFSSKAKYLSLLTRALIPTTVRKTED